MADSVLAREYIEFAVKGSEAADQAIDQKKKKLDEASASAGRLQRALSFIGRGIAGALQAPQALLTRFQGGLEAMKARIDKLAGPATKLAALGGGLIGFAGRVGLGNTREADQLGKAFEYLGRVLGTMLVPYVRVATSYLIDLANWIRNLDQGLKDNIAQWVLIGTATAAFIAALPAIVTGVSAVVSVLGLLTSPVALAIAAFGALVAAAGGAFDGILGGGQGMADSLDESNKSWMGSFVKGLGAITKAAAQFFNWFSETMASVSDKIGRLFAQFGEQSDKVFLGLVDPLDLRSKLPEGLRKQIEGAAEAFRLLPEGTAAMYDKMAAIKPVLFDIKALDDFFVKAEQKARDLEQMLDFGGIAAGLRGLAADFGRRVEMAKQQGGAHIKSSVSFEGIGATWERLQKALAEDPGLKIQEAQLGQLKDANANLQKALTEGIPIKGLAPVIQ